MANLNDLVYRLKEFWSEKGIPLSMWDNTGTFCQMVTKKVGDWKGKTVAQVPVKSRINGNTGPNYATQFINAATQSPSGGENFQIPKKNHWSLMRLDGDILDFASPGGVVGNESGVQSLGADTASALMRAQSYLYWGSGDGRIAKGDGAFSVAGQVIKFLNKNCVNRFEEDDVLVFVDPAAPNNANGMPTPRAFAGAPNDSLIVTAVDDNAGTVTVDKVISTAIPTATNADYISKDSFFGEVSGIIDGVFSWLPLTTTQSIQDFGGVVRSKRPARLSGRRVALTGNETPYDIVGKLAAEMAKARGGSSATPGDDIVMIVPADEIAELIAESSRQSFQLTPAMASGSPKNLTFGHSYYDVMLPGIGKARIVWDQMLCDPDVTAKQDRTYAMLNMRDWYVQMSNMGLSWRNFQGGAGGTAFVKQVVGSDEFYADFGMKGNLICRNIGKQVVATTRANQ